MYCDINKFLCFCLLLFLNIGIQTCSTINEKSKPNLNQNNIKTAYYYFKQGRLKKSNGEIDAAINAFSKAIMINPSYIQAYINRAFLYDTKKDYSKAIEDCNLAINIDPGFAAAYHTRGIVYDSLARYADAIKDYNKAIQINPNSTRTYYNRGISYIFMDNILFACKDWVKSCDLGLSLACQKVKGHCFGILKEKTGK